MRSFIGTMRSVRYVTVGNKRYACVAIEEWEALLEWLETLEDLQVLTWFKKARSK